MQEIIDYYARKGVYLRLNLTIEDICLHTMRVAGYMPWYTTAGTKDVNRMSRLIKAIEYDIAAYECLRR